MVKAQLLLSFSSNMQSECVHKACTKVLTHVVKNKFLS